LRFSGVKNVRLGRRDSTPDRRTGRFQEVGQTEGGEVGKVRHQSGTNAEKLLGTVFHTLANES